MALLTVALIDAPLFGSPSPTLGLVLEADHAQVSSAVAAGGATIFDGDRLSTDSNGTMRVRLGAAQLYLLGNSGTAVHRTPGGISAVLERGTLILSSATEAIELHASQARIRPKTSQPTTAQVTLVGPNEFLVTCQRGQLEVATDDAVQTVPEATSYRVVIDPPEAQDPQGVGSGRSPRKAGRTHFLWIALILIGTGTGLGVWRALVSPDSP